MSLSKTGGTLNAGGSDTVVVSIGAGADSLAIDTYSDTVTFTNTTNNSGTTNRGVSLSVILVGDVDNDGIVSILDVLRFVWVYGTSEGEAGFNPVCDLDRDGSVGMADLLILVSHFGETK